MSHHHSPPLDPAKPESATDRALAGELAKRALRRSMEIQHGKQFELTEEATMNRRSTDDAPGEQPTGFRFRREIDLNNVITIVCTLAALSYQWNAMDKRVTVVEVAQSAQRDAQRDRDTQQDSVNKESYERLRESLVVLTRTVEKLADNVERTRK